MVVDGQAIHARGFGPVGKRVSGIGGATLTSLLTRSETVLRSWRVCRPEVLGKGCWLSRTGSWRDSSVPSEIGVADV